ncbi:MAG: DUF308 domain-containing protein [Sulfitobacter sp.]|nr:DUF308 domain-containing protein [Sulfitobacter sp.]
MRSRLFFIISGIILLAGGIWAIFAPFAASLAATIYAGAAFAVAGAVHVFQGFRDSEDRLWNIGFGLLGILLGLSFVINPLGGMMSLTIVLGILFLGSGFMQLYLAWKRRVKDRTLFLVLSGVVSVALAVLIAFNFFTASVTLPGVVLGVELISTGFALLTLRPRAPEFDKEGYSPEERQA